MAFITNITTTPVTGSYGPNGYPLYVDNDHGNIRDAGTIASTTLWSSSDLGEGNPIVTIVSGVGPVEGAVPGAFNSGLQVLVGYTSTIAGVSNTVLQGADTNSANVAYTPLQLAVLRTYYYKQAVRAGNWNIFTGAFSSINNNASSGAWNIDNSVDNASTMRASGVDVAANPTQDAPGRLTYLDGNPNPVNKAYPARYNW
jgi:hypothetical protein